MTAKLVTVTIGDIMIVIDFERGSVRVNVPEDIAPLVNVEPPAREVIAIGEARESTRIH